MNNRFLILTFIIFFSTFFSQIAWSQRDPLNKKISIKIDKQPVEKVLKAISSKAKINFSYNPDVLPVDSIVSVNFEQKEVYKILNQLLQNKYYYKTTGQHIIILRKKSPVNTQKGKTIIRGSVNEIGTGIGIPYVSVYEIDGKEGVLSDVTGNFEIPVFPKSDYIGLVISKLNYTDTIIFTNTAGNRPITLYLRPELIAVASIAPKIDYSRTNSSVEQSVLVNKFVKKDMIFHAFNLSYFKQKLGQISFLPYAGTNYKFSGSIVNNISLNLIAGYSYGTKGVELGTILNINRKELNGVQISGFGNITGGETKGVQIAGFFNHSYGKVKGVQLAGFHNMVLDSIDGVQISGFANILKGKIKGSQISGFANITTDEVVATQFAGFANVAMKDSKGVQMAGFANVSNGDQRWIQAAGFANVVKGNMEGVQAAGFSNYVRGNIKGIQASGFINIAHKDVNGLQAAGFMNTAHGDVTGVQASGFVNHAKKVKGWQFGFINIADTVSGASIGVFNFIKKGLHQVSISANEIKGVDVLLNLGTCRFYSIFGYSLHPFSEQKTKGIVVGFGTQFFATRKFSYNLNLTSTKLTSTQSWNWDSNMHYKFAADCNLRFSKHFSIFAGPSFNVISYNAAQTEFNNYTKSSLFPIAFQKNYNNMVYKAWPGASLGMKFNF